MPAEMFVNCSVIKASVVSARSRRAGQTLPRSGTKINWICRQDASSTLPASSFATRHLKNRQGGLRPFRIIQAEGAGEDSWRGIPGELQWEPILSRAGAGHKTFMSLGRQARRGDEFKPAMTALRRLAHQLERQAPHRVARIQFHHRLQSRASVGFPLHEGVKAQRTPASQTARIHLRRGARFLPDDVPGKSPIMMA